MSAIDDIKKQIQREDDEFYGDETVSGSNPDPEKIQQQTVRDLMKQATGKKPKKNKPYYIADDIDEDEEDIAEHS